VLPLLAEFRRQTGLPHRIVVDEAHYFLHDSPTSLLDLELNGYTLVTYRASHLTPDILAASQAVVVTRESDPHEVEALFALCQSCRGPRSVDDWKALLGRLAIGEAAILPVTDEAEGALRHIRLAPRLTPHVRHLAKYVDVPVTAAHAFVFWRNGVPTSQRVRTLRDFVAVLDREPGTSWLGHVRRGDFSRWIQDVFGDYPLAATMREIEAEATTTGADAATAAIAGAVRARYELLPQASSERRDPAS
jgi:hypothetical protein